MVCLRHQHRQASSRLRERQRIAGVPGPILLALTPPSRSPSLALLILKCRKWANEMGDLQAHIPPVRPSVLGMAVSNRGCAREKEIEEGAPKRGRRRQRRGGGAAASLDELDEAIRFPITITNEHDHRPGSPLTLTLTPRSLARRAFAADAPLF